MIFIKNMTEFKGKDFGLTATQQDDTTTLTLLLPNKGEVDLLASTSTGIFASIKKSLDHIGKKTRNLSKDGQSVSTQLLDKYPTEVVFYVKDKKISLERNAGECPIPIMVDVVEDEDTTKRFPRDMVVIVTPFDGEHVASLQYDPRNLVGKPIIATVEEFTVIIAMVKWPVWANLKFPAYLSVVVEEDGENGKTISPIGSVQFSSKTDNGVVRNTVIDANDEEAMNYLEDSRQIMEERAAANRAAKRTNNNNKASQQGNPNNRGNNGNGNARRNNNNNNRGGKK